MNFLTDPLVQLALHHFDNLNVADGDWFFSTFGPGNLVNATDRPHERFDDYESLLKLLQERNQRKYEQRKLHNKLQTYEFIALVFLKILL